MIDEEKQIDNTADQQGETSEGKRPMTSETTVETMNLNDDSEANTPVTAQANPTSDPATVDENTVAEAGVTGTEVQEALSEMAKQVELLKAQLEERNNQYVRIAADFDNFRKRSQKEKEDLEQQVKRNTILELLPIVDNFERARSQFNNLQTDDSNYLIDSLIKLIQFC